MVCEWSSCARACIEQRLTRKRATMEYRKWTANCLTFIEMYRVIIRTYLLFWLLELLVDAERARSTWPCRSYLVTSNICVLRLAGGVPCLGRLPQFSISDAVLA